MIEKLILLDFRLQVNGQAEICCGGEEPAEHEGSETHDSMHGHVQVGSEDNKFHVHGVPI